MFIGSFMDNQPIATLSPIILASGSPRRQDFLRSLGLSFRIRSADIDESAAPNEPPAALAQRLAEQKAQAVARQLAGEEKQATALIIAADTVVALGGEALGKPLDAQDATAMLRRLRARSHQVVSAVSLLATTSCQQCTRINTTTVFMRPYSDAEISAYVASGDPLDKAGAYAIQHPTFAPVDHLEGCLSNVIGLPLGDLCDLLTEFGVKANCPLGDVCERQAKFPCCRR
jgi:MAF protein